jgi:hypothetical protein
MLNKGIRNIGIKEEPTYHGSRTAWRDERKKKCELYHIINDRKILEFLLSHNGREVLCKKGIANLVEISIIENLDTISPTTVKSNTSTSSTAEMLMDVHNPFLIFESNENEG